jgi:hypothetical protein
MDPDTPTTVRYLPAFVSAPELDANYRRSRGHSCRRGDYGRPSERGQGRLEGARGRAKRVRPERRRVPVRMEGKLLERPSAQPTHVENVGLSGRGHPLAIHVATPVHRPVSGQK